MVTLCPLLRASYFPANPLCLDPWHAQPHLFSSWSLPDSAIFVLSAPYPEDMLKAEAGIVIGVVILFSSSLGMTQFLSGVQIFRCNGLFFLFVVGVSCNKINLVPVILV